MKVYAHRGSSGKYPEMTRTAYEAAIAEGADGFECDVRLTKDDQIVCIHDRTTRRIADRNLRVAKNKLKTLQRAYELITLNELLDLAIGAKKDLLIETKHPVVSSGRIEQRVQELLALKSDEITSSGIEVIVMSFQRSAVRRISSDWKVCKVSKYAISSRISRTKIAALDIELIVRSPKIVNKLQSKGVRVFAWTVNQRPEFELCSSLKVDGVITNFPKRAKKYG